jgi:hypothetical protein
MRTAVKRVEEEVPRGVCGGLEVPPARCAWYYHAHLVLTVVRVSPLSQSGTDWLKKAFGIG